MNKLFLFSATFALGILALSDLGVSATASDLLAPQVSSSRALHGLRMGGGPHLAGGRIADVETPSGREGLAWGGRPAPEGLAMRLRGGGKQNPAKTGGNPQVRHIPEISFLQTWHGLCGKRGCRWDTGSMGRVSPPRARTSD